MFRYREDTNRYKRVLKIKEYKNIISPMINWYLTVIENKFKLPDSNFIGYVQMENIEKIQTSFKN